MESLNGKGPLFARLALGSIFTVFGLNGFFHFIPMGAPEGAAGAFMGGLAAAGYFFPLLKGTEVLVGLALLGARFVPLALTVLAPITINILAFHSFLAPAGLPLAVLVLGLHAYLAWSHREAYRGVLALKDASDQLDRHVPATAG